MTTFDDAIASAAAAPDPVARNRAITGVYAHLGRALADVVGHDDANWLHFGAWASASAGEVISGNRRAPGFSRRAVVEGNTAIITDIGPRFARFLEHAQAHRDVPARLDAILGDPALTESPELADAFACYARLASSSHGMTDRRERAQLMFRANVRVAHHEQRFADPLIDAAIPGQGILGALASPIITVGLPERTVRVTRDVPRPRYLGGAAWPDVLDRLDDPVLADLARLYRQDPNSAVHSNAPDWQDLNERMGYIFCLFRAYQCDPDLQGSPLEA